MLVFVDANLVMFAVPKTGTTAYHGALKGQADIAFSGKPNYKHMPVRKYERHFGPFLEKSYGLVPDRMAVIRNPIDQIRSWYKYRNRPATPPNNKVPEGLSFDSFVADVIREKQPQYASFGNQWQFLKARDGQPGVHHLFAYEHMDLAQRFLEDRLNRKIQTERANVSPQMEAPLSDEMEARLRDARPQEFALYERLIEAGGLLQFDLSER